jgi:GWxTD domain-containing protein
VTVHWNLEGRSDDELFAPLQLRDSVVAMARGAVVPRPGSPAAFTLLPSGGKSAALYVPLPAKRLTPGQYTLTLSVAIGTVRGEQKSHFDVIWPLRPLSLTRFDLAVDALQHIMAPAEFDEIKGESSAKAEEHLRRFWQSRNPDSTRAYNPVMLEYYRRVDEAVRRFSVRNEPNGQKSDRGRILILFGPPSRTDRSLKSGSGTIEVWTYDRLRKRFTFSDPDHSGVYVLIRSEDL